MYKVNYVHQAVKTLQKLPSKTRSKVFSSIELLKKDPFVGKKLQGKLDGLWSFRVWPYRIIYIISKKEIKVLIVEIGHRQGIYQ